MADAACGKSTPIAKTGPGVSGNLAEKLELCTIGMQWAGEVAGVMAFISERLVQQQAFSGEQRLYYANLQSFDGSQP